MAGTGLVRLERRGLGLELRRGPLTVELDGHAVHTLAGYGEVVELAVAPGPHVLRARSGRYLSRALEIEVFEGGEVTYRTHGVMAWPRWLVSLLRPDLGISLHRV